MSACARARPCALWGSPAGKPCSPVKTQRQPVLQVARPARCAPGGASAHRRTSAEPGAGSDGPAAPPPPACGDLEPRSPGALSRARARTGSRLPCPGSAHAAHPHPWRAPALPGSPLPLRTLALGPLRCGTWGHRQPQPRPLGRRPTPRKPAAGSPLSLPQGCQATCGNGRYEPNLVCLEALAPFPSPGPN